MIINTCKELNEINDLHDYLSNDLVNELYFKPKKVNKVLISNKLNDSLFIQKFNNTMASFGNVNVEQLLYEKISQFESDTTYKLDAYKIYVIIGLDTTTIYSIKYNNEDVTVLLLESTNGDMDYLDMLYYCLLP